MSPPETGIPVAAVFCALWLIWCNVCGVLALVHAGQWLLNRYHHRRHRD